MVKRVGWNIELQLYRIPLALYDGVLCDYAHSPTQRALALARDLQRLSSLSSLRSLRITFSLKEPDHDPTLPDDLIQDLQVNLLPTADQLRRHALPKLHSLGIDFNWQEFLWLGSLTDDSIFNVNQRGLALDHLLDQDLPRELVLHSVNFTLLSPPAALYNGLTSIAIENLLNREEDDTEIGKLIRACPSLLTLLLDFGEDPVNLHHIATTMLANAPLPHLDRLTIVGLDMNNDNTPSFNSVFPDVSILSIVSPFFDSPLTLPDTLEAMFRPQDPCQRLRSISLATDASFLYLINDPFHSVPNILYGFYDKVSLPALTHCSFECLVGNSADWRSAFRPDLGNADSAGEWIDENLRSDLEAMRVPPLSTLELLCKFVPSEADNTNRLRSIRRVGTGELELGWTRGDAV